MIHKIVMIFFTISISLYPSFLYAHGVRGKVGTGGMVVKAEYDDGEPMSYAKVRILAPGTTLLFQSGRTDKNGRFCFFPDTKGDWNVVIDDEMGHRLEVIAPVDKTLKLHSESHQEGSVHGVFSLYERAVMGVSILFGISGLLLWWKGKGRENKV